MVFLRKFKIGILLFFLLAPHQFAFGYDETIIAEKYLPKFKEVEDQAVMMLNHLINEAYIEYEVKKEKGELTLPILFSYIEKGNKLETEVDLVFQGLLDEMKAEIKAKGLQEDLANQYEMRYLKSKRKNKLQILKNITFEGPGISFERKY